MLEDATEDRATNSNLIDPPFPPQDVSALGDMDKPTDAHADVTNASVGVTRGARIFATCALLAMSALAYAGQLELTNAQSSGQLPLGGLGLIALALVLLLALGWWTRIRTSHAHISRPVPTVWQASAALTVLLSATFATVWSQAPTHQFAALLLWLASCAALLCATMTHPRQMLTLAGLRRRTQLHAHEGIALGLCLLVALGARAAMLHTIPPVLGGDEGSMGLEARTILDGQAPLLFVTGWLGHPRLSFGLIAATMRMWGDGIVGLRMHAALVGTITLLPLYLLMRVGAGPLAAQGAVWLLATMPFHIHFSRLGTNNIEDGLIMGSLFAALLWASHSGRMLAWMTTGVVAAMGLYLYPGARITPVFVAAFAAVQTLHSRGAWLRRHWFGIILCTAAFLIAGAPMLRFYLTHWDDFNARLNQVGIIQNGWLRAEAVRTGHNPLLILLDQAQRSLLSVIFYRDRTVWYNDTTAVLPFWPALFFPFGLAVCLWRWKRPLPLVLLVWFFGTTLIGGALTDLPPSYSRLGGMAPALAAMLALGIQALSRLAYRLRLCSHRISIAITVTVIALLALDGMQHYFLHYTPQYLYGSVNAELATMAGEELARLPADTHVYFLGPPRMNYSFSTIPFLAPQVQGSDLDPGITGPPVDYTATNPAFFFAVPEREPELRRIQQALPGGMWVTYRRVVNDDVLWHSYHLRPPVP